MTQAYTQQAADKLIKWASKRSTFTIRDVLKSRTINKTHPKSVDVVEVLRHCIDTQRIKTSDPDTWHIPKQGVPAALFEAIKPHQGPEQFPYLWHKDFHYGTFIAELADTFTLEEAIEVMYPLAMIVHDIPAMTHWALQIASETGDIQRTDSDYIKTPDNNKTPHQVMRWAHAAGSFIQFNDRRKLFPIADYTDSSGELIYQGSPVTPRPDRIPQWAQDLTTVRINWLEGEEHKWRLLEQFEWDEKYAGCGWVECSPVVVGEVALYRMFDAVGVLLYVGQSINWTSRLKQHKGDKGWFRAVARVDVEYYDAGDIDRVEREAIIAEQPVHNVTHNV